MVCWGLPVGKERSECQARRVNLVGESVASFLTGRNRDTHFLPISWKHEPRGRSIPYHRVIFPPPQGPGSFFFLFFKHPFYIFY